MYAFLIVLQMIISVLLVLAILFQASKGGGLAGIAGGMASSTVFGGRGAATFLSKATTILATVFFLNCLGMAVMSSRMEQRASVTQRAAAEQEQPASPVPDIPGGDAIDPNASSSLPVETAPTQTPAQTQPEKSQ